MASAIGKTGLAFTHVWHLVDAQGQVLGNLARGISSTLMGEWKPIYNPRQDCGDHVVVINARKVAVNPNVREHKIYRHHTQHPGGLKEIPFKRLMESKPTEILRRAVQGQIPNKALRPLQMSRLHIFADGKHPYAANIIKYHEDPLLEQLTRRKYFDMSAQELQEFYEQEQQRRLSQLVALHA